MVDAHEDGSYGVPQAMVPAIARAVLETLAMQDINPYNVYLSGHDGLEPDPDAAKLRALRERREYSVEDEYAFPADDYDEDALDETDYAEAVDLDLQADREDYEEAVLDALDEPEKPIYAMSDVFTLERAADEYTNPIHYAGISPRSTIVVYDATLINRWDPNAPGEAFEDVVLTQATEAELAIAVLARIRLRYSIEGETDESPAPIPNN